MRSFTISYCCGFALLLIGLLAPVAFPAPAPASDKPKAATAAEKIRKALDETLPTLEITDQPLKLVIAQLKEQTRINFVPDYATIAQMGIDMEGTPVTVKLHNVKLRSALRTIFAQHNLGYAIIGDSVVVTTDEMAMYRQLKQRVSLDLDRVQLGNALKQLARETATNLLLDGKAFKEGQTAVTLQLDDVPLETAVRLLSEMAGLKPVRVGNVLYVTNKASAVELRTDPELAPLPQPRQPGVEDAVPTVPGGGIIPGRGIVLPPGAIVPAALAVPAPLPPSEKK